MALRDIKIPLYSAPEHCSSWPTEEDVAPELIANEFAGRLKLTIKKGNTQITVECYFDDLERAWNAVKR